MTLIEYVAGKISALMQRIAAVETRLREIEAMAAVPMEQSELMQKTVAEVASLRLAVDNLSASMTGVQAQITDLVGLVTASASAHANLREEFDAVRADVQTLKSGVGDPSNLPPLS